MYNDGSSYKSSYANYLQQQQHVDTTTYQGVRNPQDQGVRNSQAHVRTHQGSGSGGIESGSRGPRRHQSFHEAGLECFDRSTQIIKIIILPLLYFSMLKYVDRSTHINELDLYIRGVIYRWG